MPEAIFAIDITTFLCFQSGKTSDMGDKQQFEISAENSRKYRSHGRTNFQSENIQNKEVLIYFLLKQQNSVFTYFKTFRLV